MEATITEVEVMDQVRFLFQLHKFTPIIFNVPSKFCLRQVLWQGVLDWGFSLVQCSLRLYLEADAEVLFVLLHLNKAIFAKLYIYITGSKFLNYLYNCLLFIRNVFANLCSRLRGTKWRWSQRRCICGRLRLALTFTA